jgi:two-component system nitrogen regulation response regulator GlnG/two-component system response regulator HydG
MVDTDTLPESEVSEHDPRLRVPPVALTLVVAWATEPRLLARAYVVPPTSNDAAYIVGRGPLRRDDAHPRLLAIENRPDDGITSCPIESPRISRVQLIIRPFGHHSLTIQNVGQCSLFHNLEEVSHAAVYPGDTLRLGRQLLLICIERPAWIHSSVPDVGPFSFGEADAYRMVGESSAIWNVRRQIAIAAPRKEHVLIIGESGTGKELVALALHGASLKSHGPLVARNAATFPESLVDAELFGNAKNYPNPGMPDRPGLFGLAHGTTLFLDEIAEMPALVQSHLLRVLDAGEYQRLGENATRHSAFRLIGATNRPALLRDDVAARLKLRIVLPGLDERREDIPLLARHLLRRMASEAGSRAERFFPRGDPAREPRLSLEFTEWLVRRSYTTHLRELERLLWHAIDRTEGTTLECGSVDDAERDVQPRAPTPTTSPPPAIDSDLVETTSISKEQVLRALEEHHWIVQRAWRPLGLRSRHALNRLMTRFGIRRPERSTS